MLTEQRLRILAALLLLAAAASRAAAQAPAASPPATRPAATNPAASGAEAMYRQPVVLNQVTHAKLRFSPLTSFAFAARVTSVPILASEFAPLCRRYPIAFIEDKEGNVHSLAILSVVEGSNSFVDEKGRWTATYIPAFIRRYPFISVDAPNNKNSTVVVDMASGCFSADKGAPLFDDKGKPAAHLQEQMEFLAEYHAESTRTFELTKLLKAEGVLVPLNLDVVREVDRAHFPVHGLLVVDEKKLRALSPEKAHQWLQNGLLGMAYLHLASLSNFESIANRTGPLPADAVPWWAR